MLQLWQSRKFRAAVLDAVFGIVLLVIANFVPGDKQDLFLQVFLIIQPVVVMYILGTAWEDSAAKRGGTFKPPEDK
jgi:uncharacterized membrane protein